MVVLDGRLNVPFGRDNGILGSGVAGEETVGEKLMVAGLLLLTFVFAATAATASRRLQFASVVLRTVQLLAVPVVVSVFTVTVYFGGTTQLTE